MTDNQLFALFQPVAPMPADVRRRIWRRVQTEIRRQRIARRVVALVALFVWLATQAASAQESHTVYLPVVEKPAIVDSVSCIECRRMFLPVIVVDGQVEPATRFWGG